MYLIMKSNKSPKFFSCSVSHFCLLVFLFLSTVSFSQEKVDSLAKADTYESINEQSLLKYQKMGMTLEGYLEISQPIVFYWSTSCNYCKKENKDVEKLVIEKPILRDSMIIAMKIDQNKKEWVVKKESEKYLLYKGDKVFMTSVIPIVFISEKFKEDFSIIANPYVLFLDSQQRLQGIKRGYWVSKSGNEDANLECIRGLIGKYYGI